MTFIKPREEEKEELNSIISSGRLQDRFFFFVISKRRILLIQIKDSSHEKGELTGYKIDTYRLLHKRQKDEMNPHY